MCAAKIREKWRTAERKGQREMFFGNSGVEYETFESDSVLLNNKNLSLHEHRKNRDVYQLTHLSEGEKNEVENFVRKKLDEGGKKGDLTADDFIDIFLRELGWSRVK